MRKEITASLLISAYWIIAGFFVAYSAWDRGFAIGIGNSFPDYRSAQPDPFGLGLVLAVAGLIFSFFVVRTLLPSRATQRRRLKRLLDEIGVDDLEEIQRRLAASDDLPDEVDRVASLEMLLHEQKRKRQAD